MDLNFKVYGSGDPIIILHGLFGSLDNWVSFAKKMQDQYTVFLLDQRDHGKSPHTDDFNYKILAEDLHEFINKEGIFQSHIMGHSMGGKTAMQLANDFPNDIDKLIVVDIAPKYYKPRHKDVFDAIHALDLNGLENRLDALDILKKNLDEGVAAFLTKNIKRNKDGSFTWKMNVDNLFKNYEDISSEIEMDFPYDEEVLFVKGENSRYIKESDLPLIKEKFPKATLETIEGAGHWVHAEKPEELLNVVVQFLEK